MRFISPVVILDDTGLTRRLLRFYMLDSDLVLDSDADQCRPTKRHKWKTVRAWNRLNHRHNSMKRRDVPKEAIDNALEQVRESITYRNIDP